MDIFLTDIIGYDRLKLYLKIYILKMKSWLRHWCYFFTVSMQICVYQFHSFTFCRKNVIFFPPVTLNFDLWPWHTNVADRLQHLDHKNYKMVSKILTHRLIIACVTRWIFDSTLSDFRRILNTYKVAQAIVRLATMSQPKKLPVLPVTSPKLRN